VTRRKRQQGFSLIELMLVMGIMGIVTAQMFLFFSAQKSAHLSGEESLEIQESTRLIVDLLAHDARHAGLLVPSITGVSSFDGGTGGADRVCVSEGGYFDTPLDGTPAPADNRSTDFPGASVAAVSGSSLTLAATDLDIDGDGDVDFQAATAPGAGNGAGIILADGVRTHCAQIDTMNPASGALTLVTAHAVPGGLFPVLSNVRSVPAIVYETGAGLTLMRNGVTLSTDVEDLQMEYWVDSQVPDDVVGGVEFPVHNLNSPPGGLVVDLARIRRMQITVVSRSTRADQGESAVYNRHRRPGVANRNAGTALDAFPRRRFEVTVLPRNLVKE
jgi:prepilin-type N-terminal cleavage/methylation domain-containing protein